MDQRNQWKFDITKDGWHWTVERPDGSNAGSSRKWATLKECAADAAAHGYVAWKAEEERRRDQVLAVAGALRREE